MDIAWIALGILLLAAPARAYIDINTGGLLAQLSLAGLGGLGVLFKILWSRRRRRSKDKPGSSG